MASGLAGGWAEWLEDLSDWLPPYNDYLLAIGPVEEGVPFGDVYQWAPPSPPFGDPSIGLFGFTIVSEPEPDEPCCPEVPEPEVAAPCPPPRVYMGSPCHAPDCIQQWEDGPAMWDGGGTWWDCEEDCDPAIEVLGTAFLGVLHPSVPVDVVDPLADGTTTTVMAIVTTAEAANYGDFTVPDGWSNPLSSNMYSGQAVIIPGDPWGSPYLIVWVCQGVPPADQIHSNYSSAIASFMTITTRMRPDQFIAGLVTHYQAASGAGEVVAIDQPAPATGQLVALLLAEIGADE